VKKEFKTIHLNYDWKYKNDYNEKYITTFPKSDVVHIPHTNIELPYNNFSEKLYQFVSSYEKTVELKKVKAKRYILHFEGVMAYSEVYVNKVKVASHKGGYTPFMADITKELIDGENKIFVMVDSTERKDIPPHGFVVDYLTYGGIYREVYITEHEENYVDNAFIDVLADQLRIKMFVDVTKAKDTIFEFRISKNGTWLHSFEREYGLKRKVIKVNEIVDLEKWTLENPVLYDLEIYMDGKMTYTSKFANRTVKLTKEGFFLNNKKIKLRGLNRHQSFPYVGYAMPSNAQKKDADICKYELGLNVVRSSHYPPSKHFLNRCDEIGLLVFNEIPGWQHIGDEAWQEVAKENVKEMIYRDYNHPSVFIWGVRINESPDNDRFYKATSDIARQLDDTRPTGGVRNFAGSTLLEDVYTYNDFVHRGYNRGIDVPRKIAKADVPYLVTEYNGHMYPTKKFDDEYHRVYHAKRHLKVQNDSHKMDNVAGAIGWCMFDYNTHKDFGSGDRICYHGVMDMYRIPKYAASAYASQANHKPYLEILSNLNIGEKEASEVKEVIVATNADYVKFYIDEQFIGSFYPSKEYESLPHPPIVIDDFIGQAIHDNEPYSAKDCDKIKSVLQAVMKHGHQNLPLIHKIKMLIVLKKNKISMDKAAQFYEKYVGRWGQESTNYKFEAYLNNSLVETKEIGSSYHNDLVVTVDDSVLSESNTYETTRVIVELKDEFNRPLTYSNEPISLKVKGPIELIGPKQLSLIGGSIGFWVKTIGETGTAEIAISSNYYETKTVQIEVK